MSTEEKTRLRAKDFSSLEQDIVKKSEALRNKIQTLDHQTKESLHQLEKREVSLDGSIQITLGNVEKHKEAALLVLHKADPREDDDDENGEVDNGDGLLFKLKSFCLRMDASGFWGFVIGKKKELEVLRVQMPLALAECVDPVKFVLEAISMVFPVDKRGEKSEKNNNDLDWACVLVLESLIPVMVDPAIGKSKLFVTPTVKEMMKKKMKKGLKRAFWEAESAVQ